MFSCTNENDRTFGGCDSTQSTTTLGMSIQFGNDNLTNLNGLVEGFSLIVTSLSNGAVHDKDTRVRFDGILNLQHLIKQRLLLLMSS